MSKPDKLTGGKSQEEKNGLFFRTEDMWSTGVRNALIETTHLKTTRAGSKSAESRFPHIIKLLISAVSEPDKLRMPSGDAGGVPGFDGVVVNRQQNRFVPGGFSVWECGTDADFRGKAQRDYDKRTKSFCPVASL